MVKKCICFLLLISLSTKGDSQLLQQFYVSAYSEAIGLPFTNYDPLHPGIEIGGVLRKNEKPNNIQYFSAKIGGFYHRRLETAIYLGGEYQYSQKLLKKRISLDLPVGIGYLHSFYPGELYEQDDRGDFESIQQIGRPHLYFNLGIGLSYLSEGQLQPFIRQELLLETPFANGIPIIPHSLLKIGVQIKL